MDVSAPAASGGTLLPRAGHRAALPEPVTFVLIALAGLLAGVASGLFGVGGGVLMVPAALYLVPGTSFKVAKAVSLLVIVASAGIGVYTHRRKRSVDFATGALLAAGGFVGAAASAFLVESVADDALRAGFGVLLALTGARLAWGATPRPRDLAGPRHVAFVVALGFAAGLVAGAFGVGGGILMVPGLVFAGVGVHLAVGTSLVAVLVNAVGGTVAHLGLGYGATLLGLGVPLALGAVPGTRLGSLLAHKLHADRLRRAFGLFLVAIGLLMFLQGAA